MAKPGFQGRKSGVSNSLGSVLSLTYALNSRFAALSLCAPEPSRYLVKNLPRIHKQQIIINSNLCGPTND